jgi:hypothetical protein
MEATVKVKIATANIFKVKRALIMMQSPFGLSLIAISSSFLVFELKQKSFG